MVWYGITQGWDWQCEKNGNGFGTVGKPVGIAFPDVNYFWHQKLHSIVGHLNKIVVGLE